MSMNWGSKEDEILIKFVRSHDALYNIKVKDYRKTQLKQKLWDEVGTILNKTGTECSKRWCYIRDYYIRRKGKPSGEAAKKRCDLLSFLNSVPSSQRNSVINGLEDENSDINSIDNTEDTHSQETEVMAYYENSSDYHEVDTKNYIINNTYDKDIQGSNNNEDSINMKRKTISYAEETQLPSAQDSLDEIDLFFCSIAKIVKKLPRFEQIQLRMQIGSLVGNTELRCISTNSSQIDELSQSSSVIKHDKG